MSENKKITVAYGDGIGPEIMQATLKVLDAADTGIIYDEIEIGEKVYERGVTSGIESTSWKTLIDNRVFLKAPITTPQGGGYKSLNVTTRKTLGLFANVRPVQSYFPYVRTHHPLTDMVIVRENEEDLYAGIEHQQTEEVVQTLKLVSRPGIEKIVRYAFEYAVLYNRKKVTCMTKDNIMKHTDGLFHRIFNEIAREYPQIESNHMIIDIGSAIIADKPHTLDVVVTLNLYGDIISDIAAQITGSVGMGGSANVGANVAMFEAIHGSAPDIAGQGIANPSGLLNAAILMLVHMNMPDKAALIKNAWLSTLEDGIHTGDIYRKEESERLVGTQEFAQAVIERLGNKPKKLEPVHFNSQAKAKPIEISPYQNQEKRLVGVDVFIDWIENDRDPNAIGKGLEALAKGKLKLKMITNRGVKVYPDGMPETFCTDHWRCRFVSDKDASGNYLTLQNADVIDLLTAIHEGGFDFIKTEQLYEFDGVRGYSLGQGE